jgi:hypothetical protein
VFNARTLVALVVAGTGLATAVWLPARHDTADASDRGRRHGMYGDRRQPVRTVVGEPTWRDEFDAPAGTPVDSARWRAATDLPYHHDGDGNLVITARRDAPSARLLTADVFAQRYGRVEVRLSVPRAQGLRPAFGMVGDDIGTGTDDGTDEVSWPDGDIRFDRRFHTYAAQWSPDLLVSSVDGTEYQRVTPGPVRGDFAVLLALVADGDRSSRSNRDTRFSPRMLVDYVRVWAYEQGGTAEPSTAPPTTTEPTVVPSAGTDPTTAPPATTPPSTSAPTTPPSTTPPLTTPPPVAKKWAPFTSYRAGQKVTYDGVTYQVRESHTSLPDWEPPALPALFAAV